MQAVIQHAKPKISLFYVMSPVVVVLVSQLVALSLKGIVGIWVWAVICGLYWLLLSTLILSWGGTAKVREYLRQSTKEWIWKLIATAFGLLALPLMFLPSYRLIFVSGSEIWISALVLALVNPWLEEFYWRGVVLEATAKWPLWISFGYSSVFFALFHTSFSWTSVMCRSPIFIANTFVTGVLYSVIAWRLKSLRWNVFSHFLVNIFSLSSFVFLNMIPVGK